MQASGTPTQLSQPPAQAAGAQQAVPPAQSSEGDAMPLEPPSAQHAVDGTDSEEEEMLVALEALWDEEATEVSKPKATPPVAAVAAQSEPTPPLPAAPEAKISESPSTLPAADAAAQPERAPNLSLRRQISKPPSKKMKTQPAAGSAAPGPSAEFKKELMGRYNKGNASTAELKLFYEDVLQSRGISGVVAEISAWEESPIVYAEAVKVVRDLIDAPEREDSARILTEFLDAGLIPTVIEATSKYRHCGVFPHCAFWLFNKTCTLAGTLLADDAALEPTVTRVNTELAAAADIVLAFISSQRISSTGISCETAFLFLALMFGDSKSCKPYFPDYAHQHGERVVSLCLAVIRKCRGACVATSDAAVETLMELALSSDKLALYAVELNAVDLLIKAAPVADTLLCKLSNTTLRHIARALCAIVRAVDSQGSHVKLDLEGSRAVLEVLVLALRLEVLKDPSLVLQALELIFDHCPTLVSNAVRAGALDLVDASYQSSVVEEFVDRLKARVSDAEASAAAAAAELLADEDAAQARAAAKAAKPKRAKKPAALVASVNASPPSAESDAASVQPWLTDPSQHTAGQALELSQSESAMRRRRRAATKAARRASAVARVRRGDKEEAAADSSDDEERSAAGDDAPPLPSSAADDVQDASHEPTTNQSDDTPAAVAAPPTGDADAPLADLFPWMTVSDSASSSAAELDAPAQAEASQPEPAPRVPSPPPSPLPPLPSPSSMPTVPFERFEALCAELARAKNETVCAKDELARLKSELTRAKEELMLAKDELDASKCVICLSAPRCLAVLPCRHLPLCAAADCAAAMGTPPRCPLCRVGVTGTMQLFV